MSRLPNNFGQITKLKGKREKPFQARKCTKKYYDEEAGVYKREFIYLGTYRTKKEALQALAKFNENPDYVEDHEITVEEVFEEWVKKKKVSDSTMRNYNSVWKYVAPLYTTPINAIRLSHIEALAESLPANKVSIAKNVRILLSMITDYAIEHDYCSKNYAKHMEVVNKKSDLERIPFTAEEIEQLKSMTTESAQVALVGIYTGLRPAEIVGLDSSMFNWEDLTITTGSKTKAGKERVIPIHSEIESLLRSLSAKNGKLWTRSYYTYRIDLLKLFPNHTPHDTRHTFVTQAKECGLDEYCLKLIVGHSIPDLTERVYTHRTIERLHKEIKKLEY